jgi:hypothetical protein
VQHGDLRLEAQLDRSYLFGRDDRSASSSARVGVAFRNEWGLIRLDFEYVGWREQE